MNKCLVFVVIALFIGVGVQPAFAVDTRISNDVITHIWKEEVDSKDYLFETIIEIANNPDIQDLLDEYENNIKFDDKGRYVIRQLLIRNPKLLFSIVFTKPEMTTQYLDKMYNQGIELVDIFGEEKALEMLDSVELTNPELFNDLNNIIMNNDALSNRIIVLSELNENSVICDILLFLFWSLLIPTIFFGVITDLFPENTIGWYIFRVPTLIFGIPCLITGFLAAELDCFPDPYLIHI